jgi:PncC family amidohydrolase
MNNIVNEVINLLIEKNITLSSCESLTGGLFSSLVTSLSGVSKIYKGGFCTYQTEVKEKVLNIPSSLIEEYGVVSSQIAKEMSRRTKEILNSDLSISFTGNAGPLAMEGKEVGLVYICLSYEDKDETYELHLKGDRNQIRNECVVKGFEIIKNKLG